MDKKKSYYVELYLTKEHLHVLVKSLMMYRLTGGDEQGKETATELCALIREQVEEQDGGNK